MLELSNGNFMLDGKKFNIYSGAIHYFRVLPEYWEDRLLKMKLAGLNTVETYVAWNVHEPVEGQFCFEGRYDIIKFIKTAKKLGLYVIIRPGPYICAEWDFGGFPAWLLKDERIRLRCYEPIYIEKITNYFNKLLPLFVPHQLSNGGNIIAFQIENEYGSYGRDKKYLTYLRDLIKANGIGELLFTADGESKYHLSGGGLKPEFHAVNFGCYPQKGFEAVKILQPDMPSLCGEYWCGWFDHFGEKHRSNKYASFLDLLFKELFEEDASINFYMFHGGTNFGFMAGANYSYKYQPTTTGYDYAAPITEYGDYSSKYYKIREYLCKKQNIALSPLPPSPQLQHIGEITLDMQTSLLGNVKNIGTLHKDNVLHRMEHYGQNHGFILYHTTIKGDYDDVSISATDVRDIAYLFVNGEYVGKYDRTQPTKMDKNDPLAAKMRGEYQERFYFPIKKFGDQCDIDILVEAMGRVNFDKQIYDRKGIGYVMLGEQLVFDWDIYTLPLDNIDLLDYTTGNCGYPKFLKGNFCAKSKKDCFVDLKGFTKGVVYINGFNLGRYWNIGPQQTLYLPGVLLKEDNEIVVLELEHSDSDKITIIDHPIYARFDKVPFFQKLFKKRR